MLIYYNTRVIMFGDLSPVARLITFIFQNTIDAMADGVSVLAWEKHGHIIVQLYINYIQ